jgi:N-dimethylarginine dimethylaminohydrolase
MTLTASPATTPATSPAPALATTTRSATPRHFLMCPPTYFDVVYAINPWMDMSVPVDRDRAVAQWETLKAAYEAHGHRVDVIDPVPGLPDMVYAANGGTVVGGKALAARFAYAERQPEGAAYEAWFRSEGPSRGLASLGEAGDFNEGEGDLLLAGDVLLAGTGFRTTRAAHAEAARLLDVPVVTLELVDPRFYHLDTALAVLDPTGQAPAIAYYPGAFSPASQKVLRERYPDAIVATQNDAAVLGLNAVSDGRHVFLTDLAYGMHSQLREHGFSPVGIDLSELLKGGGSVKCCTLELRPARTTEPTDQEARA